MTIKAFVFPASRADQARIVLDSCNVSEPAVIYSGPHKGKMFLDAALAERDPRWIPLFQPLISDPANEVQQVVLSVTDIQIPQTL